MDFVGGSLDLSLHYLTSISAKQRLTSANIANAHTPGYTAREMSFAEVLKTDNPFETDLSQRMGSKLSEMNNNTGLPVDLQKELVEMQKNMLFYSMTFTVTLTDTLHTTVLEDGTLVSTVLMQVDADVGHVIGVSLNYAVTGGTLSSTTGISGANGATSVTWTVTPAEAAASGQTDLIFSACSDSNEPATCVPGSLASLHIGS